jgi:nicotinamide riboside transporter PnuC
VFISAFSLEYLSIKIFLIKMTWWKKFSFVNALAGAFVAVVSVIGIITNLPFAFVQEGIYNYISPRVNYAQVLLNTNYVGAFSKAYVHHPLELEGAISELMGHEDSRYVVLVGPRGCGK